MTEDDQETRGVGGKSIEESTMTELINTMATRRLVYIRETR